ncbi:MAG: FtsQ-type POTRA domain-containing protein [Lactobacillaceae bacterium]|jgi:cell division protein FtsQ|nr:FtsQ-type POTRA domain-containing protein [Lactobacillaceae bacterium]
MSTEQKIINEQKIVTPPLEWPYRLLGNVIILCIVFSLALIAYTLKQEIVSKKFFDLTQYFYEQSNKMGWTLDDIIIENRNKTTMKEIKKALGLDRDKNILSIDVSEIKTKLETLPWIKTATVKRGYFPNVIHITLKEKEVESLWQVGGKFHPIDEDGKVINAEYIPTKPIMLIVGKGAPENFKELLQVIKKDEDIFSRIKVANYISGRRWNVVLDNIESGVTIKLPETNIEETWNKLIKINKTRGIFKRKLTIIDLRLPDKVVVKIGKMNPEERDKLKNTKESKI